ncbi:uncharacterized protein LOC130625859 [Hydractinia symbiolongicarpus]|uniref:uncharacterized protein LOC130625859 n=1 Tax=Hydractinia symbiolongicarpus TaxID=13093 RepID=UPI00254AE725|nr:uncharacterized protein LOC130625859 [Hydractinia symbiolongicarpus]
MQFVVSFVVVLICTFASSIYGDLRSEIDTACGRRSFTPDTNDAITAVGDALGLPVVKKRKNQKTGLYDRCHTLSFEVIREHVCDDYPTGTSSSVGAWRKSIDKLSDDLHTIDNEWFLYGALTGHTAAYQKFVDANNLNKNEVQKSLDEVIKNQGQPDEILAGKIGKVLEYMNSATANLRPGAASINRSIGGHLDPLLNKKKISGQIVSEGDLTAHSKHLGDEYGSNWKRDEWGIKTSDRQ